MPVAARQCGVWLLSACLAQSVERQALNLVVVGSSPTVGVFAQVQIGNPNTQFSIYTKTRICTLRATVIRALPWCSGYHISLTH